VFRGRGPRAIDELRYFTGNPDPFLRDRAVQVVGAAVTGSDDTVVLEALAPYLNDRNQFIRKLAVVALGRACEGQASPAVLEEIRSVGAMPGPRQDEVDMAAARLFAARPTEDVYPMVARPGLADRIDTGCEGAVAQLVRGASDTWYERAYSDVFEPRLHSEVRDWRRNFIRRNGLASLAYASPGRGFAALQRMLHLRGSRCTGHALIEHAPDCFAEADIETNRPPLLELIRDGDVPAQRIAAVCLGRLTMGIEDEGAIAALRGLCRAGNLAVQAAALRGLGMAARSTCDDQARQLCLERADNEETAPAALWALGMVFLSSGRRDVADEVRRMAEAFRARPARRRHCRPLAQCYGTVGRVYLGTGSAEPVEFLLDVLAMPRDRRAHNEYQWQAARALMMVEFPESKLGWPYISLR
jgi:hypothetical protein